MALSAGKYFWAIVQATNSRIVQWTKSAGNVIAVILGIISPYLAVLLSGVLEGHLSISATAIASATKWTLLFIILVCILLLVGHFLAASFAYASSQHDALSKFADAERAERRGAMREMIAAARADANAHYWSSTISYPPYRRIRPYLPSDIIQSLETGVRPAEIDKPKVIKYLDALTVLEIQEGLVQPPCDLTQVQ